MIVLYHAPGSRSCRVLWLLEELGQDYRIEPLAFGDGSLQKPEYLAKNPLGKVPTIEDGDVVLYESGAILEYLLEQYGKGRLAPAPGSPERARYLQWLHWGEATLFGGLGDFFRHRFMLPEEQRVASVADDGLERFHKCLRVVEDELSGREYLLDSGFSGVDIQLGYGLKLAQMVGVMGDGFPKASAYLERLAKRPAFQKAFGG